MRQLLAAAALLLASCASNGAADVPAPLDEPFRVLLLGDSISIGYTPFVEEALEGRAVVMRPRRDNEKRSPENCQGTNNGIKHIDRWLAIDGGEWDVIHFNFGLHDLKRVQPDTGKNSNDPTHPHQADPERYEAQLRSLVRTMKATDARLVFATTTPVPPGKLRPYREPQDSVEYNAVALRVMRDEDVPVNDLFTFVTEHPDGIIRVGDVHYSKDGSRSIGGRVAEAILEVAGHGTGESVLGPR